MNKKTTYPPPPTGYQAPTRFEYPRFKLQIAAITMVIVILPILFTLTWLWQHQIPRFQLGARDLFLVIITVLTTVWLHEFFHGLAYSLFGYRVSYGTNLKLMAAYAAAFEQWQSRNHNFIVALAPLVILNGLLIPLLLIPGPTLTLIVFTALLFNSSGAVGDLYLVWCLWRLPTASLLYDIDVKTMLIYVPADK